MAGYFILYYTYSVQYTFIVIDNIKKSIIYLSTYLKKSIIRNWLTQLWSLRNPTICCLQAGDPVKQVVYFKSKGLGTRINVSSMAEDNVQAEKAKSASLQFVVLFRPSTDFRMATFVGEVNLLYSVQFKC